MLAQLTINIIDRDGIVTMDPITLEVELAENSDRIIDAVEQTFLDWREGATRTPTPTYLNTPSLKKTRQAQAQLGGDPTVNSTSYRVDGEVGRLTCSTDALTSGSNILWNSATDLFAALGPREYYRTAGMTELVLSTSEDLSYRKTTAHRNRIRREKGDPTPVRTVAATLEREGTQMQAEMRKLASEIWTAPARYGGERVAKGRSAMASSSKRQKLSRRTMPRNRKP